MKRSYEHERNAGCFDKAQIVGNRNDIHLGNGDQFAIPAINRIPQDRELTAHVLAPSNALRTVIAEMHWRNQDPLTGFYIIDVFTDLDYLAGDVATQNMRQLDSREALPDPKIQMVHSNCFHPDQHLVFARLGIGNLFVP